MLVGEDGWMQLHADSAAVTANGDLVFTGHSAKDAEEPITLYAFAAGQWERFWAASAVDSTPICEDA